MSLNTTAADPAADSYADVTTADAYFAAQGLSTWTGTDAAKENALRRGTQYLDNQYRDRWIGIRSTQNQALSWPRGDGTRQLYRNSFLYPLLDIDGFPIDTAGVPTQVAKAAMEAALLVLTGVDMQPILTPEDYAKSIHTKVDVLEKEVVYSDSAPAIKQFKVIEGLLRGLVSSSPGSTSGTVKLVRG